MPDIDQFIPASLRLVVTLAAIGLSFFVLYRSTTAKTWKEERDAALEKVKRITEENAALKEKLAVLEAQRDLTAVQEGQASIVRTLETLALGEAERFTKLTEAITQLTKMTMGFQSHMAGAFEARQQIEAEMVMLLRDINNNTRG